MSSLSPSGSAWVTRTAAARPSTLTEPPLAVRATVSIPAVPVTVTKSFWLSVVVPPRTAARSTSTLAEVGPGQVPDRDVLVPEEGPEADRLDGVEVHGDVADVAGHLRPRPALAVTS